MTKRRQPLIPCTIKDKAFVPLAQSWAMETYSLSEGEMVFVKIDKERFWPGHQAFMAFIRDVWHNLSDEARAKCPTPDILRYRMLIACGYKTTKAFVCKDEAEAIRLSRIADSITPISESAYRVMSIVKADDAYVLVIEQARSQAMKAMNADEFEESVLMVEDEVARMFGITRKTIAAWKREKEILT